MRAILVVGGVVLLLIGLVWALQGAGILLGSVMSNDSLWLVIGSALIVVGVLVLVMGLRGSPRKAADPPASGSRTT